MIWEKDKECLDREELEQLQLERLQATLNRVWAHVPFYRHRFDELGLEPEGVGSLADLARLPLTTREDLQTHYPYGFFAIPLREVVRIHASSGIPGAFTAVGYTRNDIRTWSTLTARVLAAGGVTKEDVVQVALDYGLLTGGFGLHYGAERIGASVIPVANASLSRQIRIMRDFKTTALVSTPSYALRLVQELRQREIPVSSLSLRWGLLGEEPWSEETRREVEESLGIAATDNYGVAEVIGPGIAGECLERNGLHVNEDHFLVEVVDPQSLRPMPAGETGELVVTTLTKEAFPVVRYRTRDLVRLLPGPCPCGRTGVRLSKVQGRTDDRVVFAGVNLFPAQVEAILQEVQGAPGRFRLTLERGQGADRATVTVEVAEALFSGEVRRQKEFVERIRRRLADELGIGLEVKLAEGRTFDDDGPGAPRVLDRRRL